MGSADDDLGRLARALAVPLDDQRRERVAEEQLRMVLSHTRAGTAVATVFAVILALHLAPGLPAHLVWGWLAAKVLLALGRIALAHARERVVPPQHKPLWRQVIYASLAADALVWGVAGAWLMGQGETVAALVAATLACVTSVATFGLQVRLAATAAYSVPIMVPTGVALALRGDEFGVVGGVGFMLLLGLQLVTAARAQRRLAATVLLQLNAQALAAEREAALTLARQQSEVKSQFVAKVSHELRTPLHGILGLARLLQTHLVQPELRHRVDLIEASGTHLLALINDLLDVSRIESGHFSLRREAFDLMAVVERAAQVFAVRAGDKGLALRLETAVPRPFWVLGDADRVNQVLDNLLGNAVKFTPEGGIRIALRGPDDSGRVNIEVEDSGVGIAPEELARIFQPFQQSRLADGSAPEGAGLGLTIAREIAQGMGGDIQAHSTPGRGSRFVFTALLPAAAAPAPPAAPSLPVPPPVPAAAPASTHTRSGRLPQRVLVAEDDDVNAMIVLAFLEGLGVPAERVADGQQAVAAALRQGNRPDLVLMDCRMPLLDGPAATREIRRAEQQLGLPRVPVVALTATAADTDRQLCLASGMDDFVPKPFNRDDLHRALLRNSAQAQPATAG